jgi:hypothetical protein
MDGSTALSIYRAEKARALQERRISHAQLMTEAKEAFAKMLADAQLARKGGRPRNNPNAPAAVAAAAAAKAKAAVVEAPAKKSAPVKVVVAAVTKVVKTKAAPAKKATSSKKLRVIAKRGHPIRAKASVAKKPPKKVTNARVSRPSPRSKSAKKR